MFDTKYQQLWPDLSRFVSAIGDHANTWDLTKICLANYRFNEYAGSDNIRFLDRSGKQEGMLLVTGSGVGVTRPASAVQLSYDEQMLPGTSFYDQTPFSSEKVPGTDTRLIRPFVRKCFDYKNRGRTFLLQENLKGVDLKANTTGYTFIVRMCVRQGTSATDELVFSLSEYNLTQLSLSVDGASSNFTLDARLFATDSDPTTEASIASMEYDKWYTVGITAKSDEIRLFAFSLSNGERVGYTTVAHNYDIPALTAPMIFIGYGAPTSTPNSSFPVGDYTPDPWGTHIKICELAIFNGYYPGYMTQAMAKGWVDDDPGTATHSRLFPKQISGLNNPPARRMLRRFDDAKATYPTIARTGDGIRTGTGPISPYKDDRTLIFSGSDYVGKIRFPEMLPEYLFEHDRPGHLERPDTSVLGNQPATWISGSGRTLPGLMDRETFIFEREGGEVFGNKSPISGEIAPFVDSAVDTSAATLSLPATPPEVTLGFDQPLGSRIAIVIDLTTHQDCPLGHQTGDLKLVPTIEEGGTGDMSKRTPIPDTSTVDVGTSIDSIAYFNFDAGRWDKVGKIGGAGTSAYNAISAEQFIASSSLAFGGTTGFTIAPDEKEPLLPLMSRGRPTDTFGFPFDSRWDSHVDGHLLDMSKYISGPFLLEKMQITHDMEFQDSGDDGLGYLIRDWKKNPKSLLALSASGQGDTIPDWARVDRRFDNEGNTLDPSATLSLGIPGKQTRDLMSYGRFPLLGGMGGFVGDGGGYPGLRKGTLIASDDNKYKVVSSEGVNDTAPVYTHAVEEEIPLSAGQTPGGAAFWRCDTFFLMRQAHGNVNLSNVVTPPPATVSGPCGRGRGWPLSGAANDPIGAQPPEGPGTDWPISFDEVYNVSSEATGTFRELITYAQIAHCGYARTDSNSQAHKSGSTWQEVHPTRAGSNYPPMMNAVDTTASPSTKRISQNAGEQAWEAGLGIGRLDGGRMPWGANRNRGWPHTGAMAMTGEGAYTAPTPYRSFTVPRFWTNLVENLTHTWPSPHPWDMAGYWDTQIAGAGDFNSDGDDGTGTFYKFWWPPLSWEYRFVNAYYPHHATYNTLGLDDCTVGDPSQPGGWNGGDDWHPNRPPGTYVFGSAWYDYDGAQGTGWFSGSYEAGGGSLISNPVMFVSESAVFAPANDKSAHGASDFFRWGGFNTPGSETKKTLLDAGLRRDLTIQLTEGNRFIRLWTADPTPGALGWRDLPQQTIYDDDNNPLYALDFWELRPTSAYLVATASRTWTGGGTDTCPLSSNLAILNSGTFTIMSEMKNSTKGGAMAGVRWQSQFPQNGYVLSKSYGTENLIWRDARDTGMEEISWWQCFVQDRVLLPTVPPTALASEMCVSYPRSGHFLHSIPDLSPSNVKNPRSPGLSTGRSYVRGVVATNVTNQYLHFSAASYGVFDNAAFACAGTGYYGWTGPVGAAHFTQMKKFVTMIGATNAAASTTTDPSETFPGQLMPYALGMDTRGWLTCLPNLGTSAPYIYDPLDPQYGTKPSGVCNHPTSLATHPPFTIGNLSSTPPEGIMRKTKQPLSQEYVYNSPYLLFPEDKLVFGFQPAIGGGNEGAPRPLNAASFPFSTCDVSGYQGVGENDYFTNAVAGPPTAIISSPPVITPWTYGDVAFSGESYGASEVNWKGICGKDPNSGGQTSYSNNTVAFSGATNSSILSEQIRKTVLKAGANRLVLYGTLLRDNKPLPSELNQPLVTDAVHEALHSSNPVEDQFLVESQNEYLGSYLDQYVTGSMLSGFQGIVSTGNAGTFSYDASFNRFVTLADEGEVYWDSVLPNPYEIWVADGKELVIDPFDISPTYSVFHMQPFDTSNPQQYNWQFPRAFPFEARYADVPRILEDPAEEREVLRSRGSRLFALLRPQTGLTTRQKDPTLYEQKENYTWLRNIGLSAVAASWAGGPSDDEGTALLYGADCFQSQDSGDKITAALLFGYARTGGLRDITRTETADGSVAPSISGTYARKTLNALPTGGTAVGIGGGGTGTGPYPNNKAQTWDHPEGVKYGLKNYVWEPTKATFRPDRFGQFRDMLEQRRYSKFFHRGDDDNTRGEQEAAVSCIFLDSDGNPVNDPRTTQCLNVSTFMTSSIPYFEGISLREIPPPAFVTIDITSMGSLGSSPTRSKF
jgi:hypothetical protein